LPDFDPAIHAELHFTMDHRVQPGGDEIVETDDCLFVIVSASDAIRYERLNCFVAPALA
jgi:hypothetical protein